MAKLKELKELVDFTLSDRLSKIETLSGINEDGGTIMYKFYEAIAFEKVNNDAEAKRYLYGKNDNGTKYNMLKQRLLERLYTTLLFIEPKKRSTKSYVHNLYFCYKHLIVAKLMLAISAIKIGTRMLEKVYHKSIEYEIFDIALHSSLSLRRQYMLVGDQKKFTLYNSNYRKAINILNAEARVEELYYTIMIRFSKTLATQPEWAQEAKKYIIEIERLMQNFDSFLIHQNFFNVKVLYLEFISDYKTALKECDDFEKYLVSKEKFNTPARLGTIWWRRADFYLNLKEYESGMEAARKALPFYSKGTTNWFSVQEIHFLLSLNMLNLDNAVSVYREVTEQSGFNSIRPRQLEVWKIFEGYLWFLLKYTNSTALLKEVFPDGDNFRLGRMLNEVPIYSKDKKGVNIALLILQVLINIQREEFSQIITRTEALRYYIYKNLQREEAARSQSFIKMILAMERASFDPTVTKAKAAKHFARLHSNQIDYKQTASQIEILSYERVWDIMLDMLEQRK